MSRYIEADALIKEIKMDIEEDGLQEKMVFYRINEAPSIDIVRCKECNHREEYPCKVYHDDDWYCANGERREP